MSTDAVDLDRLTYCDCAACGRVVLGDSWRRWWKDLSHQRRAELGLLGGCVEGRIEGRPYCKGCLRTRELMGQEPVRAITEG